MPKKNMLAVNLTVGGAAIAAGAWLIHQGYPRWGMAFALAGAVIGVHLH